MFRAVMTMMILLAGCGRSDKNVSKESPKPPAKTTSQGQDSSVAIDPAVSRAFEKSISKTWNSACKIDNADGHPKAFSVRITFKEHQFEEQMTMHENGDDPHCIGIQGTWIFRGNLRH